MADHRALLMAYMRAVDEDDFIASLRRAGINPDLAAIILDIHRQAACYLGEPELTNCGNWPLTGVSFRKPFKGLS